MSIFDPSLNRTAAEILAYAVAKLFPGVQLVDGGPGLHGFYYDFVFQQTPPEQMLPLIEETMRAAIKTQQPLETWEMVRDNAAALFNHLKQRYKAQLALIAPSTLIKICAFDTFRDYCSSEILWEKQPECLGAFKLETLYPYQTVIDGNILDVIRIRGAAFADKESLKKHYKKARIAEKEDHRRSGRSAGFFFSEGELPESNWFWTLKGQKLLQQLKLFWWKMHPLEQYQPIECYNAMNRREAFLYQKKCCKELSYQGDSIKKFSLIRLASLAPFYEASSQLKETWGMCRTANYVADLVQIFCCEEFLLQELICSLQFIEKIVNIFKLEAHWVVTFSSRKEENSYLEEALRVLDKNFLVAEDSRQAFMSKQTTVKLMITDAWGYEWSCGKISLKKSSFFDEQPELAKKEVAKKEIAKKNIRDDKAKLFVIQRSSFGSIERFAALFIEKNRGCIPLDLCDSVNV